ncbi:MAG: RNA polymerase sigma factor [Lachnospiraceae bacterium]
MKEKKLYEQIVQYITENQEKFYRLAFSYVRNEEEALDIVQNSIVKALEKYDTLRNPDAIKTWFFRIIVNESLGYIKKSNRELAYDPELLEDIEAETPKVELNLSIQSAMDQLNDKMRTVIYLYYFEEMNFREIAKITGTNLSTVKYRHYTALKLLKKYIE